MITTAVMIYLVGTGQVTFTAIVWLYFLVTAIFDLAVASQIGGDK